MVRVEGALTIPETSGKGTCRIPLGGDDLTEVTASVRDATGREFSFTLGFQLDVLTHVSMSGQTPGGSFFTHAGKDWEIDERTVQLEPGSTASAGRLTFRDIPAPIEGVPPADDAALPRIAGTIAWTCEAG